MKFITVCFVLLCFSICSAIDIDKYLSYGQRVEYINNVPIIINDNTGRDILVNENRDYSVMFVNKKSMKNYIFKNIFNKKYYIYHNLPVISVNTNLSLIEKLIKQMPRKISIVQEIAPKTYMAEDSKSIYMPNDPDFKYQWYLYNPNAIENNVHFDLKYLDYLKYVQEHKITRDFSGYNPVIAQMDSGFYFNTVEFKDRVYINKYDSVNGKDDDGNGYVDDYMGVDFSHPECNQNLDKCIDRFYSSDENVTHAIAMMSIMAANANNGEMMVGLLPQSFKILPISAESKNYTSVDQYLKAYDYILDMKNRGVNIIAVNMSIGGKYDVIEHNYIKRLNNAGIMVIASAGNEKKNIDLPNSNAYPAALFNEMPNVISVGALDNAGSLASTFSNYGNKNVSLYMPGVDMTTIEWSPSGLSVTSTNGTSQAAAVMSGVFGIAYWLYPNMNVNDLRTKILSVKHAYYSGYMSNQSKDDLYYFNTVTITDFMDNKTMPYYKYNTKGFGSINKTKPLGLIKLFGK